jgi:tRNA A22 N-methylase
MDYQILVNIAVGVITLMGGWVFKMVLGILNEIKGEHHELMLKHHTDIDKLREKHNSLALSLPKEYVSKEDFKMFSERMNDRFDRLEEKIDNLNKK